MDVIKGLAAFAGLVTIGAGAGYALGAVVLSVLRRRQPVPVTATPTPVPRR